MHCPRRKEREDGASYQIWMFHMPVLRQVPRSEVTSELINCYCDALFGPGRDPVAEPGTATGTPGD